MCDEVEVCPLCPIPFLNDLDVCDLENYKHPPFMWTLWYLALIGKAIYDKVKELLDSEGGDDGGDGGDKKKEDKKGDKAEKEDKGGEEEEEEAPPPEEEAPAEEAPAEEAPAEEAPAEEEG